MAWVEKEYAGELAVVFAWLTLFLPWNITYVGGIFGGSVLYVRFPFVQLQYWWGTGSPMLDGASFAHVGTALTAQSGQAVYPGYVLWSLSAVVIATAGIFATVYYLREAQLQTSPVNPVTLIGVLLLTATIGLTFATIYMQYRGLGGIPLPIGLILLAVFSAILLRTQVSASATHH